MRRILNPLLSIVAAALAALAALVALAPSRAAAHPTRPTSSRTVWLCHPGQRPDPCTPGLSTTVYSPSLRAERVTDPHARRSSAVDCFYVYPTVSGEPGPLSDRVVHPEERSIALYQAARYSQLCRVYAPMYRQVTVPALLSGDRESPAELRTPLADVEAAFADYLRSDNDGRPFVLIGHSQGSFVLEQLIARRIDPDPALRERMLSAILLGGNVLVPRGRAVGGTFRHIPACRRGSQLHCVIAFSTFDAVPPADSLFGRTPVRGDEVLCTNPARLAGNGTLLDPIVPSAPFARGTLGGLGLAQLDITQPHPATVFSSEPGAYSAHCSGAGGAHVLRVSARDGAQTPTAAPSAAWGLHLLDATIALGNLVSVVRHEAAAYAAHAG